MATINYNGMELEEFTSDKPVFFDPPKKCVVWYDDDKIPKEEVYVLAYESRRIPGARVIGIYNQSWAHCAIIPDPPKPRRATNRELARWLAQGNGEIFLEGTDHAVVSRHIYSRGIEDMLCGEDYVVRKWSDTEWHEPTVDYLFGGDE